MRRSTLIAVVLAIAIIAVVGTLLLGRYRTPSYQQRIIEQQQTATAAARP